MTPPIPSSAISSSASNPPIPNDHDTKKRPLEISEKAAADKENDAPPSKKLKTDVTSNQAFEKYSSDAETAWNEHNNAQVMRSLKPLLKTPLSYEQQKIILELFNTITTPESDGKDDAEIALYNAELYSKLHESLDSRKTLILLAKAIESKQISLIIRILEKVDLSQDNPETRLCMEKTAKSNPTIARFVLAKKPHCDALLLNEFFKMALEFSNDNLFSTLLSLIPKGFHYLIDDELCAQAIAEQSKLTQLILTIEPMLETPAAFFALIEIGRKDLTHRIAQKDPAMPQKVLTYGIARKFRLPLNDKAKASMQYLISLGASLKEPFMSQVMGNFNEGQFDVKLAHLFVESLLWLIEQGASILNSNAYPLRALVGISGLGIPFLKALPKSFPEIKRIFNEAFNAIREEDIYPQVFQIAKEHSADLIDVQASLDLAIAKKYISIQRIKFLQSQGGNIFGRNGDNLLICRNYTCLPLFREHSGYKEALCKTGKNGLGILTHLAFLAAEGSYEHINTVAEDILKNIKGNPNINLDVFCCGLLLHLFHYNHPVNLKKLFSHAQFSYQQMEEAIPILLKACNEKEGVKLRDEQVLRLYDDFVQNEEPRLFITTSHYQQGIKAAHLTDVQQEAIAKVNFHDVIGKMLSATNFASKGSETVNMFLRYVKDREQVTGVPPGIPNEILRTPFQAGFENFEKSCRKIIPEAAYAKILSDFPAYMSYNVIADKAFESKLIELKTAFEKDLNGNAPNAISLLRPFVEAQTKKENFYSELEDKLRLIIYSYCSDKPSSAASSSSSSFDLDSASTLLCTIVAAMEKCATKWASDLQLFEEFALEQIQKANKDGKETKLTDLECRLHTVLAQERSRLIRLWATQWTQRRIELQKRNGESIAIQNAEYGYEIHYAYAALQHRGQYLGIPRAEKNVEHLVKWTTEMDNDFLQFFRSYYTPPTNIIDFVSSAINQIDKSCVIDWMKDNLMGSWEENTFAEHESKAVLAIQQALESLQGSFELAATDREQLFNKIWQVLSVSEGIVFNDFRSSVHSAALSAKSLDNLKSMLSKIVKDASLKSRKTEFNKEIHNKEGNIKRNFIRKFLLMHNIMKVSDFKVAVNIKPKQITLN